MKVRNYLYSNLCTLFLRDTLYKEFLLSNKNNAFFNKEVEIKTVFIIIQFNDNKNKQQIGI